MNKKILIDTIGVLLIALVVLVGYKLSPLLLPKADIAVPPSPSCDLQAGSCETELPGGGMVRFGISPRPIPLMSPLQLDVAVTGREVDKVEIDFAGVGMNMGLNRPQLQALGDGRFSAQSSLPLCVSSGTMDWQATLFVDSGRERLAIPFRFTAGGG